MYQELAQPLDTVIHNGALVNHAFTYEQLFEPNVLGSLQVSHSRACYARSREFDEPRQSLACSVAPCIQSLNDMLLQLQQDAELLCTRYS